MRLSKHFTLAEFLRSDTANRLGIENTPTAEHLKNLGVTATNLEKVRKLLGNKPIIITSGYRNPELNKAVGGVPNSDHALGFAADFVCPRFGSAFDIAQHLADSDLEFDQLIYEQGYSDWVHISFNPRIRGQVLSKAPGKPYVNGIVRR